MISIPEKYNSNIGKQRIIGKFTRKNNIYRTCAVTPKYNKCAEQSLPFSGYVRSLLENICRKQHCECQFHLVLCALQQVKKRRFMVAYFACELSFSLFTRYLIVLQFIYPGKQDIDEVNIQLPGITIIEKKNFLSIIYPSFSIL